MASLRVITAYTVLFLGVFVYTNAEAQYKIVDKKKTWNVLQSTNRKETLCYKFYGDTIIHDTLFHTLKYSLSEHIDPATASLVGFVREDTAKSRVYLRFKSGETFLIYNFKQKICDYVTIPSFDYSTLIAFQVEFTDTVMIDGQKRFRLFLVSMDKSAGRDQVWIEGIGSTVGLIETGQLEQSNFSSKLLCCKSDGNIIWQSNDKTCYFSNVDKRNKITVKGKTTGKDEFVIPLDFNAINLKVRIYRPDGKIMRVKKIKKKSDLSFDKFKPGIYLIEIVDYFDRIYYTRKIKI